MILNTTIRSYMNRQVVYGNEGDEVVLIRECGNVLIVALPGSTEGFSVKISEVTDKHEKIETPIIHKQPAKTERRLRPAAKIQNELF